MPPTLARARALAPAIISRTKTSPMRVAAVQRGQPAGVAQAVTLALEVAVGTAVAAAAVLVEVEVVAPAAAEAATKP